MNAWVWWIVAAGVLAVAEVLTGGTLVLLMLAGGAAAGGLTAALGAPPALSVGVFALVSVALLGLVRPIARRHMRVNREARTNVAALVGAEALAGSLHPRAGDPARSIPWGTAPPPLRQKPENGV